MMSAVYAVVITVAALTVQVYQMEPTGKVTVAVFQNITQVMIVMTVQV